MIKNIFMATALFLSSISFAGPVEKMMGDLECGQQAEPSWELGYVFGQPAYLVRPPHKFKGEIDQTIGVLNRNNRLQRVMFAVDIHLPGEKVDYKQSDKIWKAFVRKYGEPKEDWAWYWKLDDGKDLLMFTTGGGTAIVVECPFE